MVYCFQSWQSLSSLTVANYIFSQYFPSMGKLLLLRFRNKNLPNIAVIIYLCFAYSDFQIVSSFSSFSSCSNLMSSCNPGFSVKNQAIYSLRWKIVLVSYSVSSSSMLELKELSLFIESSAENTMASFQIYIYDALFINYNKCAFSIVAPNQTIENMLLETQLHIYHMTVHCVVSTFFLN